MASSEVTISFTKIRPSPTNPHKTPTYINPNNIGSKSFDSLSSIDSVLQSHGSTASTQRRTKQITMQEEGRYSHIDSNPEASTSTGPIGLDHVKFYQMRNSTREDINRNEMIDGHGEKKENKQGKKVWLCKFITGIIVILIAIVGTVYFILYYSHPDISPKTESHKAGPPKSLVAGCSRLQDEVKFQEKLLINCTLQLNNNYLSNVHIRFNPIYGNVEPVKIVNLKEGYDTVMSTGWNITVFNNNNHSYAKVMITRETARCSSGGNYNFTFHSSTNTALYTHSGFFEVQSKVSDVQLEVSENNSTDNSFYEVTCSAKTDCTGSPIALLGVFGNGQTGTIPGMNISCFINYNDFDGWSARCTGTIPSDVYSGLQSIICRPSTGNTTVDEEAKLSYKICRDCVFKCPADEEDSYWYDPVICNIYHRCVYGKLYTMPCGKATYFNAQACSCDHTDNILDKCDENDDRVERYDERQKCS